MSGMLERGIQRWVRHRSALRSSWSVVTDPDLAGGTPGGTTPGFRRLAQWSLLSPNRAMDTHVSGKHPQTVPIPRFDTQSLRSSSSSLFQKEAPWEMK